MHYFLSASNDATIKAWNYEGENIATYYGHSNYIYRYARAIYALHFARFFFAYSFYYLKEWKHLNE